MLCYVMLYNVTLPYVTCFIPLDATFSSSSLAARTGAPSPFPLRAAFRQTSVNSATIPQGAETRGRRLGAA